jgi:cytochrome c oxidase cbb3-type subunit 3
VRKCFSSRVLSVAFGSFALLAATSPQPEEPTSPEAIVVARGKAQFVVCASCHGMEGEGRTGIAPRLNSQSFLAAASDEMLARTITEGRTGTTMMAWEAMYKPDQVADIVRYMRSWQTVPTAELDESPLAGDAKSGQGTFDSICSACHGANGGGYQESANGTGIGRAAFLASVSNGYLRYLVKQGKSGTAMRPFSADSAVAVANLSNQQVDDVIAYLRDRAW